MDLRALSSNKYFLFSLVFLTAGCESSKSPVEEGKNAEEVYLEAGDLLKNQDFEDAGKKFKDIETYFPYSEKASTAQIMAAYCNFRNGSYIDSVRELDIFLRYHPTHELVPYAMYLRAMSKYMTVSTAGRDAEQAKESRGAFIELINKFPTCKYAEDSKKKIIVLDDIIAAHELIIGRYYQKNKSSLSAIKRYGYVVSRYPNTKSAEEAFYRMVECFRNEELMEEANSAASVLKVRYPNGRWTKKLDNLR
jgi:outer membrane protein assembly factor BamD